MPSTNLEAPRPAPGKPYKGLAMEGPIASWYTKIRAQDAEIETVVAEVRRMLPAGGRVLEVAPGPGYLAIELARQGMYRVVGLDISASFVRIARAKAQQAGVAADFQQGNASDMPFEGGVFDLIICRAAFKNFSAPVGAIREMYRVLRPGGTALILDLRRDASRGEILAHVEGMGLGRVNRFLTQWTFKHMLLKSAYTGAEIGQMVAQTPFQRLEIREDAIGMEIRLDK